MAKNMYPFILEKNHCFCAIVSTIILDSG